jgi:hypothetical protein
MKKLLLLSGIAFITLFTSCKKTVVEQLPSGLNFYLEQENTAINIKTFEPKFTSPDNVYINAGMSNLDRFSIQLQVSRFGNTAILTEKTAGFTTFNYYDYSLARTYYAGSFHNGGDPTGTITITKNDVANRRIEGSFSLVAVDNARDKNKTNLKGNFACNY